MLSILHGDDIVLSRQKLNEIISNFQVIRRLDGKNLEFQDLVLESESSDLFFEKRIVIIENYFRQKRDEKMNDYLLKISNDERTDIVIWEDSKIDGRMLRKYSLAKSLLFERPHDYFLFLDSISPQNDIKLKSIFDRLSKSFSPEQLFYSLIKRIKFLIVVKENQLSEYAEANTLATWQGSRLRNQAALWSLSELEKYLERLFDIEKRMKTGTLPLTLSKHIDILLFSSKN